MPFYSFLDSLKGQRLHRPAVVGSSQIRWSERVFLDRTSFHNLRLLETDYLTLFPGSEAPADVGGEMAFSPDDRESTTEPWYFLASKSNGDYLSLDAATLPNDYADRAEIARFYPSDVPWEDFTPDLQFATIGNGQLSGRLKQDGKLVTGYGSFILGSTSAVSNGFSFRPPIPTVDYTGGISPVGQATYVDASGSAYPGWVVQATTDRLRFYIASSPLAPSGSTAPFTWTTNDQVLWAFEYEAA